MSLRIAEAEEKLIGLIARAHDGEEIVIVSDDGTPLARLEAINAAGGSAAFREDLTEEELLSWESEPA